jgi:hypothetical protein
MSRIKNAKSHKRSEKNRLEGGEAEREEGDILY